MRADGVLEPGSPLLLLLLLLLLGGLAACRPAAITAACKASGRVMRRCRLSASSAAAAASSRSILHVMYVGVLHVMYVGLRTAILGSWILIGRMFHDTAPAKRPAERNRITGDDATRIQNVANVASRKIGHVGNWMASYASSGG